jgi:hypothetical protein
LTFEAILHQLWTRRRHDRTLEAYHDDPDFDDSFAREILDDKWKWKALGKSDLKAQSYREFDAMVDQESSLHTISSSIPRLTVIGDTYFKSKGVDGNNDDYQYVLRSCGNHVQALIDQLDVDETTWMT